MSLTTHTNRRNNTVMGPPLQYREMEKYGIHISLLRRIFHYFRTHRLRTLKRKAKSTWPDQLRQTTKSTRNPKQNSVEAHLRHSIILQQPTYRHTVVMLRCTSYQRQVIYSSTANSMSNSYNMTIRSTYKLIWHSTLYINFLTLTISISSYIQLIWHINIFCYK